MQTANQGHAPGYGDDAWTQRASDLLRELFEKDCEVFFTFNGTSANALALASLCQSYHSILCQQLAHVETDECGAPEFFSNGTKLLLIPGDHGRVDPDAVCDTVLKRGDIHFPKPRVLSLTQATEMGTIYSISQLQTLQEVSHRHGLRIHMDGARFANAVASLDVAPKEITWKVGVDVLCFGGTKNGMAVGEAVIFSTKGLQKNSLIVASRRDNWLRKCGFWRPLGWECWNQVPGWTMHGARTLQQYVWRRDCKQFLDWNFSHHDKRMPAL